MKTIIKLLKQQQVMDSIEIKRIESQIWTTSIEEQDQLTHRLDRILDRIFINKSIDKVGPDGRHIINVCGGSGFEAEILLQKNVKSVVVLDIAPQQLLVARTRARRSLLNGLECVQGDAENLPFRDKAFSLGYVHMGLHHLSDYAKGITELCRVSEEVVFVDIMRPLLVQLLNLLGLFTKECGRTPNRVNTQKAIYLLEAMGLKPTITSFFVPPLYTYNQLVIRCYLALFKAINSFVNRSKLLSCIFGNVAIIWGFKQ